MFVCACVRVCVCVCEIVYVCVFVFVCVCVFDIECNNKEIPIKIILYNMYYKYSSVARCVIYLFLGMQMRVLNIIYGWVVMVSCTCIHLTSGVIVAINIISIDEENWLNITL